MKKCIKVFGLMLVLLSLLLPNVPASAFELVPDEQWKKNVTGSAGVLENKSVLINIFISDKKAKWSVKSRREANKKVSLACQYLKKEGKKYKKNVELISDPNQNEDLAYEYKCPFIIKDSMKNQNRLYKKVTAYIQKNIDLTAIRTKYETDSIGFLLHVNKSGVSSTQIHYMQDKTKTFFECSTLFSKYERKPEGAATYAHEILHLFGARDLYCSSPVDGLSKAYIKHILKRFPNDIMFSTYTSKGKTLKYRITNEISRNTAYFLGWKKDIPERKKYAIPKMKAQGCFSIDTSL